MAATGSSIDRLRGNILGGFTAAVLSMPTCVGFGVLALAPLGRGFHSAWRACGSVCRSVWRAGLRTHGRPPAL